MASKRISELTQAEDITPDDLFIMEQGGTAKSLTGEVLIKALNAEVLARVEDLEADIADLKYEAIDILSVSNSAGTQELGAVVNELTINWTLNKEPVSQSAAGETVAADARSITLDGLGLTATQSFTVSATDERGAVASATTTVRFLNGVYYGKLASGAELNSAAILGLSRKLQSAKALTFTVDAGDGEQISYALPTRYGTPVFKVGGFEGGFYLAETFLFTNASGYVESYDVWLSDNAGLGSTTVEVS